MKVLTSPGSNPYCVPAALSAITGKHVDEILELLREYLGDQPVSGIYYPIALAILEKLGYQFKEVNKVLNTGAYLCISRHHMFVVNNGIFFDNLHPNGANLCHKFGKAFLISCPNKQ